MQGGYAPAHQFHAQGSIAQREARVLHLHEVQGHELHLPHPPMAPHTVEELFVKTGRTPVGAQVLLGGHGFQRIHGLGQGQSPGAAQCAKLTGGGLGGNIIALTPGRDLQDDVANAIEKEGFQTLKTVIGVAKSGND